jgi:ABC-type amino acid transport substrate-binding protein
VWRRRWRNKAASGNAATGKFHPPAIRTDVDEAVKKGSRPSTGSRGRALCSGRSGFRRRSGSSSSAACGPASRPRTPYYQSGRLFYVLEGSPYQTIDDLNKPNVRFVYGTGTAQLEFAKKYVPKAKISNTPLRDRLLLHDFLAANRADATMSQAAAMKVILEKFRDPPLAAIGLNGRIAGERASSADLLDPFDVAFGLPEGDERWRGCVNAWVRDLLDSGRMAKRLDYWLAQPVT